MHWDSGDQDILYVADYQQILAKGDFQNAPAPVLPSVWKCASRSLNVVSAFAVKVSSVQGLLQLRQRDRDSNEIVELANVTE